MSSYQLNSKDNGLVLLLKTVLRLLVIFPHLSSVGTDGNDKHGLKLQKKMCQLFQVLMLSQKSPKGIMVSAAG